MTDAEKQAVKSAIEWWRPRLPLFRGCTRVDGSDAGKDLELIIDTAEKAIK